MDTAGPPYLLPGSYTMSGSGGADVGSFNASFTLPTVSNPWTNATALVNIARTQDLTIAVNPPGDNTALGIIGNSTNSSIGQTGIFTCLIPLGVGSFTIPSYVLSALPVSSLSTDLGGVPMGLLSVVVLTTNPTKVQAQGVDTGYFDWAQIFAVNVNFQ